MSKTRIVGTSSVRVDGMAKVTGAAQYVEDLDFGPGLLHAVVVESTRAHAMLKKVDVSAAVKAPGVVRVVTGKDFPYQFGLYMLDRYIFAQDRVRFVGEQIAAVIAETPEAALRAARLVQVEYQPLPPVLLRLAVKPSGQPGLAGTQRDLMIELDRLRREGEDHVREKPVIGP